VEGSDRRWRGAIAGDAMVARRAAAAAASAAAAAAAAAAGSRLGRTLHIDAPHKHSHSVPPFLSFPSGRHFPYFTSIPPLLPLPAAPVFPTSTPALSPGGHRVRQRCR
jgi:hypothetical protein